MQTKGETDTYLMGWSFDFQVILLVTVVLIVYFSGSV